MTKTALVSAEQLEDPKGYIAQMRALNPARPGRVETADRSGVFDTLTVTNLGPMVILRGFLFILECRNYVPR
jgi:hypothetical protein